MKYALRVINRPSFNKLSALLAAMSATVADNSAPDKESCWRQPPFIRGCADNTISPSPSYWQLS